MAPDLLAKIQNEVPGMNLSSIQPQAPQQQAVAPLPTPDGVFESLAPMVGTMSCEDIMKLISLLSAGATAKYSV